MKLKQFRRNLTFLIFLLVLLFPFKAMAYNQTEIDFFDQHIKNFQIDKIRVYDFTKENLLTNREKEELLNKANSLSNKYKVNVMAFVVDNTMGYTTTEFADDLLDITIDKAKAIDISLEDSIVFLISNSDRRYALSTTGKAIKIYDSKVLSSIENSFINQLSEKNYAKAIDTYISKSDKILSFQQKPKIVRAFYPTKVKLMVSLIIGFIFALVMVMFEKNKLNTVRFESAAHRYEKSGNVNGGQDIFLYRNFIVTKRPTNNSSFGSGGTHTSSGGRSHGGSSGSF